MALVFATDFSDAARHAQICAAKVAHRLRCPLFLVHAVPAGVSRAAGEGVAPLLTKGLEVEASRLAEWGGEVKPVLVEGDLGTHLERMVTEHGVRAVLTARRPRSTQEVGQTVTRLARMLPVPLVVLQEHSRFEAWAGHEGTLKVLVGFDGSESSLGALGFGKWLQSAGDVELTVARLFWPSEEARRFGLKAPPTFDAPCPELEQYLEAELQAVLERSGSENVHTLKRAAQGRLADELSALTQRVQADVLAVGTRRRTGLGKLWSVSHHSLHLSPMSVAVVPTQPTKVMLGPAPLRRVLVATDLSPLGNHAVATAFALTKGQAEVHILYVANAAKPSPPEENVLRAALAKLVPEGHPASLEIAPGGEPSSRILQAAERINADLICVGSSERTGVSAVVMGSCSQNVLARALRPVLVVKPTP